LFYAKIKCHENVALRRLAELCHNDILPIASKYDYYSITTVVACLSPALQLGGFFVGCVFWLVILIQGD